jgi:hypothetical protein
MNRTAIKEMTERAFRRRLQQGARSESSVRLTLKRRRLMNKKTRNILGLALLLSLTGCVSPTPMLDETFGDTVRAARLAQTLHPDAGRDAAPVVGLDGIAAQESIKRYEASFRTPPPVSNVINIGGVMTGGGAPAAQ